MIAYYYFVWLRMEITALSLSALLSLMSLADENARPKIGTYEMPAIAGLWQLNLENPVNDTCYERYNFGKDGTLSTISGAERTTGTYQLYYAEEMPLPVLTLSTQYDNNEPDCSGNQIDQSGEQVAVFVKLDSKHNPTTMQWCADSQGQQCFSDFKKILP